MTSIEQAMVAAALTVGAILMTLWYPHAPDLTMSTRAMLHGGFESRTVTTTEPEIISTRDLLRGTML